jgi:hypothetical protein
MWEPMSDSEVVQAFLDGDQRAFGELVKRYDTRLLNFVYRTLRDRERAQDLVQEALMKAWANWGRYRPGGSLGALCLGGSIGRYVRPGELRTTGVTGFAALPLGLASTPSAMRSPCCSCAGWRRWPCSPA